MSVFLDTINNFHAEVVLPEANGTLDILYIGPSHEPGGMLSLIFARRKSGPSISLSDALVFADWLSEKQKPEMDVPLTGDDGYMKVSWATEKEARPHFYQEDYDEGPSEAVLKLEYREGEKVLVSYKHFRAMLINALTAVLWQMLHDE